jgi:hypothetical protein
VDVSDLVPTIVFIVVFVGAPAVALWFILDRIGTKHRWQSSQWRSWAVAGLAAWIAAFSRFILDLPVSYVLVITAGLSGVWWVYFGTLIRLHEQADGRRRDGGDS